jgi:3-hydroxybutyrate dehydrogenase
LIEAMTEQSLQGRAAVVTGSTSGIGQAIAAALAERGAAVMLNGFGDAAAIEAARSALAKRCGVDVAYSDADLTKPAEAVGLIEQAAGEFGQVDILINNAGANRVAPIDEYPPEEWDRIVALNLSAPFHTIRAALPGMKQRKRGRIVNTASTCGLVALPDMAPYVSTKHGIIGLTKTVALEAAPYGITCNAVCPGLVNTALSRGSTERIAAAAGISFEEAEAMRLREKHPNRRMVEIEEVALLAVFLCSDSAQSITGTAIPIDGGWTTQ